MAQCRSGNLTLPKLRGKGMLPTPRFGRVTPGREAIRGRLPESLVQIVGWI